MSFELYSLTYIVVLMRCVCDQNSWLDGRQYKGRVGEGLERVLGLVEVLHQQIARRDLTTLHRVLCRVESELLSFVGAANNGEKNLFN